MSTPIADLSMVWICAVCGKRPWAYAEHCACGAERPAPTPPQPLDVVPIVAPDDAYWMRNWR